jgi:ataxin-3
MQKQPSYLGENYIAMMLHQIECDGYSVFAIKGNLPESEGDRKARAMLRPLGEGIIEGKETPNVVPFSGQGHSMNSTSNEGDTELEKAIQSSIEDQKKKETNDMDEIRRKRLARFGG